MVVEPARLHDVVAHGAGDEVVLVGVAALDEELGLRKAQVGAYDVLAQCPPAEVIHLFHLAVGTFEQRYLTFHPRCCFAVGDELGNVLVLHRVEVIDVVLEVIPFEQGGQHLRTRDDVLANMRGNDSLYVTVNCGDVGQSEAGLRIDRFGIGEVFIFRAVGLRVGSEVGAAWTCAKRQTLDL